jgi:hypothetical protein
VCESLGQPGATAAAAADFGVSDFCSKEFLEYLKNHRAYQGVDVEKAFDKFLVFFKLEPEKAPLRKFLTWLNREWPATAQIPATRNGATGRSKLQELDEFIANYTSKSAKPAGP